MRYETSISAFDPDDPSPDAPEHEFHVVADLFSDGDGGLDVELEAWREDDALDPEEAERFGLAETVFEEAWASAYVLGNVPIGIYRAPPTAGCGEVEVLAIVPAPGRFAWYAVCRRPGQIPFGRDDAHGYFLVPHYRFGKEPPGEVEGEPGTLRLVPDAESDLADYVLLRETAPDGQVLAESACGRCGWRYARPASGDSGGYACSGCGMLVEVEDG